MTKSVKRQTFSQVLWLSFCESDERYLDMTRVLSCIGVLTFLGLAIHAAAVGTPWDPVSFGSGLGGLLFGGAVGTGLRAKLEDGTLNAPAAPTPTPDGPPFEQPSP